MKMRRILFCLVSLFGLYGTALAQSNRKAVIIIADGIPADVIERLKPPAMEAIIGKGRFTRAFVGGKKGTYTQTPTISAPGYNDMLTGTWAYKHNVWDNDGQQPNYNYPTIFRLLKTARPTAKTAIFSTWIENRKMLLGQGLPQTGNLPVDYVFDGYEKDTIQYPHDKASLYLHQIDERVVGAADSTIRAQAPDLSWIYLEYTDDIGHSQGTGAEFDRAIGLLDKQMARVAEAIRYRETNFKEEWLLVITTDHGRDSITGNEHGDQSDRERTTWMILNHPVTNAYFKDVRPGIVDILPSVCNFLRVPIATPVRRELDGTPFIGDVSITNASLENASLEPSGDQLTVRWKSYPPAGKVKIYISFTNDQKLGKPDQYRLLGGADAAAETFTTKVPGLQQQGFYKVVVEGENNTLNVWNK